MKWSKLKHIHSLHMVATFFFFLSFVMVQILNIYPLSKFQVHNSVLLTIVTLLYVSSPELTRLIFKVFIYTFSLHIKFFKKLYYNLT